MLLIIPYILGVPSNQKPACDCSLDWGYHFPICDWHHGPNCFAIIFHSRCDYPRPRDPALYPWIQSGEDGGEKNQGICEKGCHQEEEKEPAGQEDCWAAAEEAVNFWIQLHAPQFEPPMSSVGGAPQFEPKVRNDEMRRVGANCYILSQCWTHNVAFC